MSRLLPCGACGHESYDAVMKVVELPPEEQRSVEVFVPMNAREDATPMPIKVREVYAAEPRCRDIAACKERVASYELTVLRLTPDVVEFIPSSEAEPPSPAEPAKEDQQWQL